MNKSIIAEQTTIQNILIMQNAPFQLSMTQKTQVSLLYYFASLDYLKGLQQRLHALMTSIDPRLDLGKLQNRGARFTGQRCATRNTAATWANNGWSFLANFELSVTKQIAKRAFEAYSITGANHCGRGLDEFSPGWMMPDEQGEAPFEKIYLYAGYIDNTMDLSRTSGRWDDFNMTLARQEFPEVLSQAPALRVRADITGHTGIVPVRTGVYLPADDPHGTPQFCWTGSPAGGLLECNTFNSLGLEALAAVGRQNLWLNDDSMHAFVQDHLRDPLLIRDTFFTRSTTKPKLAPSLVARNAFTSRSCNWIYVEQIPGELENWTADSVGR